MSIFFVMEDFIFAEIISFYIVLQTLNPSKAGPLGIVHFKGKKCVVRHSADQTAGAYFLFYSLAFSLLLVNI